MVLVKVDAVWFIGLIGLLATLASGGEHPKDLALPPGVELVNPKDLGLSDGDLDKFLGKVKLLSSSNGRGGGPSTQILTVGFGDDEKLNLQDFEQLSADGLEGRDKDVAKLAFNKFKQQYTNNGDSNRYQDTSGTDVTPVFVAPSTPQPQIQPINHHHQQAIQAVKQQQHEQQLRLAQQQQQQHQHQQQQHQLQLAQQQQQQQNQQIQPSPQDGQQLQLDLQQQQQQQFELAQQQHQQVVNNQPPEQLAQLQQQFQEQHQIQIEADEQRALIEQQLQLQLQAQEQNAAQQQPEQQQLQQQQLEQQELEQQQQQQIILEQQVQQQQQQQLLEQQMHQQQQQLLDQQLQQKQQQQLVEQQLQQQQQQQLVEQQLQQQQQQQLVEQELQQQQQQQLFEQHHLQQQILNDVQQQGPVHFVQKQQQQQQLSTVNPGVIQQQPSDHQGVQFVKQIPTAATVQFSPQQVEQQIIVQPKEQVFFHQPQQQQQIITSAGEYQTFPQAFVQPQQENPLKFPVHQEAQVVTGSYSKYVPIPAQHMEVIPAQKFKQTFPYRAEASSSYTPALPPNPIKSNEPTYIKSNEYITFHNAIPESQNEIVERYPKFKSESQYFGKQEPPTFRQPIYSQNSIPDYAPVPSIQKPFKGYSNSDPLRTSYQKWRESVGLQTERPLGANYPKYQESSSSDVMFPTPRPNSGNPFFEVTPSTPLLRISNPENAMPPRRHGNNENLFANLRAAASSTSSRTASHYNAQTAHKSHNNNYQYSSRNYAN